MKVDEYRARAERYEEVAKRLRSAAAKQVYKNLAHQWWELAKQAESRERVSEAPQLVVR